MCETAGDPGGKEFIEALAKISGYITRGYTGVFAFTPHGEEWTARPGRQARQTGTFPGYTGHPSFQNATDAIVWRSGATPIMRYYYGVGWLSEEGGINNYNR